MKKQDKYSQHNSPRQYLLPFLVTHPEKQLLPLGKIQVLCQLILYFQLLKYPIDYMSSYWIEQTTPIFIWLDPSYWANSGPVGFQVALIVAMVVMSMYVLLSLLVGVWIKKRDHMHANMVRLVFIIVKNVLFMPLLGIVMGTLNCRVNQNVLHVCHHPYSFALQIGVISVFIVFTLFLGAQTYLSFEFLLYRPYFVHIKRSAMTSVAVLAYIVFNQVACYMGGIIQLTVINVTTITMLVLAIMLQQYHSQFFQLLQIGVYAVISTMIIFYDLNLLLNGIFPNYIMPIICIIVFLAVMQLRTYNIDYQLKNINKWSTSQIMIKYTTTLRWLLSRRDDPLFAAQIYGYMQIYRQKCGDCGHGNKKEGSQNQRGREEDRKDQQFYKMDMIIKKIFQDGYRLSPVSPQLQLQNATFLYQRGQKQMALRTLLNINRDKLTFIKLYCYVRLRDKIQQQIKDKTNQKFLDLLSDLHMKQRQKQMFKLFQRASLINLQFWSQLNEQYPDFAKFNQSAIARVRMRQQIKEGFQSVCLIANSDRVTGYYANYLESIQNDEDNFEDICVKLRRKYRLDDRIRLHDWDSSSSCMMLVSTQQHRYGQVIDLNTSCASILGYKKAQLKQQLIYRLFVQQLKKQVNYFLDEESNGQIFTLTHKNHYVILLKKKAETYNSMGTGMASLVVLEYMPNPYSCVVVLDKQTRVVGCTASTIPVLNLELKVFDNNPLAVSVFAFSIAHPPDSSTIFPLGQLLSQEYLEGNQTKTRCRVRVDNIRQHYRVGFQSINQASRTKSKYVCKIPSVAFKFGVQADPKSFFFLGTPAYTAKIDIKQFTQSLIHAANNQPSLQHSYAQGIAVFKLRNNIIQMVQDDPGFEQQDTQHGSQSRLEEQKHKLAQASQEKIFANKQAFQEFVGGNRIGRRLFVVLVVGIAVMAVVQVLTFVLYRWHSEQASHHFSQSAYQYLLIGGVFKQRWQMTNLQLMSQGKSLQTPQDFYSTYLDNKQYIQRIRLLGNTPHSLSLSYNSIEQQLITSQFLQTKVNYMKTFIQFIPSTSNITTNSLISAYNMMSPYQKSFLGELSGSAAKQMYLQAQRVDHGVEELYKQFRKLELGIMGACLFVVVLFLFLLMLFTHLINKERVAILELFLDLPQAVIQQMSSKTQSFLVSIHSEQNNLQDGGQDQQTKKSSSSTMSKRKRFKQVQFPKSTYIKLSVIPLFFLGYFIHASVIATNKLQFQVQAVEYIRFTAAADYQLYYPLWKIVEARSGGNMTVGDSSGQMLKYNRRYLQLHDDTFGKYQPYHTAFSSILLGDICQGIQSQYGNTSIPISCRLPQFSSEGIYQIFTNAIYQIQNKLSDSIFQAKLLLQIQVLSKAHRKLSQMLMIAQRDVLDRGQEELLLDLLIWLGISLGVGVVVGVPLVKVFVDQINQVGKVVSVLPVGICKQNIKIKNYIAKMENKIK